MILFIVLFSFYVFWVILLFLIFFCVVFFFFFKQKTAYELRISDWSSDVCSSDLDDRSCLVVARHALAMADALGLPVTMAHVVEIVHAANAPADPLEWQLRLGECRERLDRIVEQERDAAKGVERVLLTGSAADELNGWARDHAGALLTLATHSQQPERRAGLGATVQKILDGGLASLLLVPNNAEEPGIDAYLKLLVPLDGPSRSENVPPFAAGIPAAHSTEPTLPP